MGKNLETQYSFRCDRETIKKLEYIAKQNTRTRNQEMKHIIREYIAEYEKKNGKIQIQEDTILEKIAMKMPGHQLGDANAEKVIEKILEKKKNNE